MLGFWVLRQPDQTVTTEATAPTANTAAPKPARNTAIDSLRVAMMCVVMFGHPLLPYTTVPRRFEDPQTHWAFDIVGVFLYGFAMPAFFVTAGFAGAALFNRRGAAAFWRNRALRIGLPLLAGYLLLTPLTRAAYEFAQAASQTGDLASAWQVVTEARWLRWGKVYHLWFLASLILFSAGAIACHALATRVSRRASTRLPNTIHSALFQPAGILGLTVLVAVFMVGSYVSGTGQGTDGWMQIAIFGFFMFGWLLYAWRDLLPQLVPSWWLGPAVAVLVMPVCGWATRERLLAEDATDIVMGVLAGGSNAVVAVGITLGLLGAFQRFFATRGALGEYISDASYWIYLIHYPVVIAAGGVMAVFDLPAFAKYLCAVALSLPIILGSYELLVRRSPLGAIIGGSPKAPQPNERRTAT